MEPPPARQALAHGSGAEPAPLSARVYDHLRNRLGVDPRDEGVLMNLTSGVMWIAAALGGLVALTLPGSSARVHLWPGIALSLVALAWGASLLTLRFPRPGTPIGRRAVLTAVLIGVVGLGLWATGGAASYLQPILLFTSLHVAYYYPPRYAWPLTALFVVVYATPLFYDSAAVHESYPGRILLFAIGVVGMNVIMRLLKRRLLVAEERQRAMAERDPLTGVGNRRAFDAALLAAIERPNPEERAAALLLLDLDHFKIVNDTYGHPTGDLVLRAVADACAPEIRRVDCLARIGGDEFAVVAPGAGALGAQRLADALATAIEQAPTPPGMDRIAVTIAWATIPDDALTGEDLVRQADHRLLERKRARPVV